MQKLKDPFPNTSNKQFLAGQLETLNSIKARNDTPAQKKKILANLLFNADSVKKLNFILESEGGLKLLQEYNEIWKYVRDNNVYKPSKGAKEFTVKGIDKILNTNTGEQWASTLAETQDVEESKSSGSQQNPNPKLPKEASLSELKQNTSLSFLKGTGAKILNSPMKKEVVVESQSRFGSQSSIKSDSQASKGSAGNPIRSSQSQSSKGAQLQGAYALENQIIDFVLQATKRDGATIYKSATLAQSQRLPKAEIQKAFEKDVVRAERNKQIDPKTALLSIKYLSNAIRDFYRIQERDFGQSDRQENVGQAAGWAQGLVDSLKPTENIPMVESRSVNSQPLQERLQAMMGSSNPQIRGRARALTEQLEKATGSAQQASENIIAPRRADPGSQAQNPNAQRQLAADVPNGINIPGTDSIVGTSVAQKFIQDLSVKYNLTSNQKALFERVAGNASNLEANVNTSGINLPSVDGGKGQQEIIQQIVQEIARKPGFTHINENTKLADAKETDKIKDVKDAVIYIERVAKHISGISGQIDLNNTLPQNLAIDQYTQKQDVFKPKLKKKEPENEFKLSQSSAFKLRHCC